MGKRKVKVGQVVSDNMDKTVVVVVQTLRHHPLYKKTVRHTKKYKAHDGDNECKIGDRVRIMEARPLSKEKRWRIVELISRKETAEPEPELNDSDSNQA